MVERFFLTNASNGSDAMMLLSGPPSCGKTSLLFQFAFNCAFENSGTVVFICSKRRLESRPPCLSHGMDPSSEVFRRIQIKYIENDEGLKNFFAAFHLHETFPSAIIIDDFGDFFDERNCQYKYGNARGKDLAMARTLALCYDAIMQTNKRLHPLRTCKLILSDTHLGEIPRLMFIYKRWIACIFTIKGDGSGSFILKKSVSEGKSEAKIAARYSIALQYLVLEGITDE